MLPGNSAGISDRASFGRTWRSAILSDAQRRSLPILPLNDERFQQKVGEPLGAMPLWYTFYNFCRIHKSLRVTPAMAAGISDRVIVHLVHKEVPLIF